tara:strand:+ start:137 stop:421 length:285 start_codon:yes stop_codon:yes gene_type:complete
MFFVYIIGSKSKKKFGNHGGFYTYVGWTNDLENRLKAHNSGIGAKSTRGRQWELLYVERHRNRSEAMSREWQLKRDRKFRQNLREILLEIDSLH